MPDAQAVEATCFELDGTFVSHRISEAVTVMNTATDPAQFDRPAGTSWSVSRGETPGREVKTVGVLPYRLPFAKGKTELNRRRLDSRFPR